LVTRNASALEAEMLQKTLKETLEDFRQLNGTAQVFEKIYQETDFKLSAPLIE
jgi:hypothetical protein